MYRFNQSIVLYKILKSGKKKHVRPCRLCARLLAVLVKQVKRPARNCLPQANLDLIKNENFTLKVKVMSSIRLLNSRKFYKLSSCG